MTQTAEQVQHVTEAFLDQRDVRTAIIAVAREQGIKVAFRGRVTRVKLADGTSGKAKCDPTDEYSALLGYQIAKDRAQVRAAEKQVTALKHRHARY